MAQELLAGFVEWRCAPFDAGVEPNRAASSGTAPCPVFLVAYDADLASINDDIEPFTHSTSVSIVDVSLIRFDDFDFHLKLLGGVCFVVNISITNSHMGSKPATRINVKITVK